MKKVVIIGASDVGISAALRIRELDDDIRPLVIANNAFPNFSICGIPFFLGGEVEKWQDLAHRDSEDIKDAGIDLMLETEVTDINPDKKLLKAVKDDGEEVEIEYDKLVLGTGGKTIVPPIEKIDLEEVFFMRWMEDSIKFDKYLKNNNPESAVIVGGGYVGLEMTEALIRRGLEVTLVEFEDTVLNTVAEPFRRIVQKKLEDKGARIITGTAVESIEKKDDSLKVYGSNDFELETDTVLISIGTKPNTELGEKAGIEIGDKGAFKVNKKMETNIKDIYAGGDCVETLNAINGEYTYYALGSIAHKHGRIIGSNICGQDREFAGALGTQSIKIFDTVIARTGFDEKEAKENGFEIVTAETSTWDHKIYYPPAYELQLKVVADKNSGRILGAQILGNINAEVSKRIDIFASAIYNEMTIEEFSDLDLSYTPPLSSPWDPVQMVVQKLDKQNL
ncbi:MAG: FAD-dependent oxidoreductase [Halanaerobiales bacterium]